VWDVPGLEAVLRTQYLQFFSHVGDLSIELASPAGPPPMAQFPVRMGRMQKK
jgi:hypothetical protein